MAIFAKYEGVDGESQAAGHQGWIEIHSLDWGAHRAETAGGTGGRRRGAAIIEDFVLTLEYGKAAPKLQEMCLKGKTIPKLEIELTATCGDETVTYLRYQLKNVAVRSFQTNAEGGDEMAPAVIVSNRFAELNVTYIDYDAAGSILGSVETRYKSRK